MTSTGTSSLQIEKPASGDYKYAWATPANQNYDSIDYSIAGTVSISTTGGTTSLTDTQYSTNQSRARNVYVTGTLTSGATIIVPNRSKNYNVFNQTTGAFTLTIQTAAPSTTQLITQGAAQEVYVDGSNNVYPAGAAVVISSGNVSLSGANGSVLCGNSGTSSAFQVLSGDATVTNAGVVTVSKVNGVSLAPSATTDTTNAANVTSGVFNNSIFGVANLTYGSGITNLRINATVSTNILTVALKTAAGTDPTATNCINVLFRDATIANGDPTLVQVTSALNMTTNAVGATLGTANTVPFKVWVLLFNNAGTPVLALWQSVTGGSSPTAIAALDETSVQNTTGISGSATSAGTFYTPNGTSLSSCAFRILGYLEWSSGLTTAGSYASTPTKVMLFGPGVKKPSEVMQTNYAFFTTTVSTSSTSFVDVTGSSITITPTSAAHPILANYTVGTASIGIAGSSNSVINTQLLRGATVIQSAAGDTALASSGAAWSGSLVNYVLDAPGTTSATIYKLQQKTNNASGAAGCSNLGATVMEIAT